MPSTLTPIPPPADLQLKRFTVSEYDRMIRDGTVAESDRLELLDGWIVEKMPHNAPHDSAISRIQFYLTRLLGEAWLVRVQSSVKLDRSVPEPDIAVVPGPLNRYDRVRPSPEEIELAVEVAESSLSRDRGTKLRIYARNKISVYWIVNLIDRRIEVYTQPHGGKAPTYRTRADFVPGETIPVMIGGKKVGTISVSELLP